jgi:hypothetical protein
MEPGHGIREGAERQSGGPAQGRPQQDHAGDADAAAREHVVTFALPKLETAADSVAAAAALAAGVADGELTPGEADRLARLVQAYTKAIEIADLAPRIEKLEEERREELERHRQRWP